MSATTETNSIISHIYTILGWLYTPIGEDFNFHWDTPVLDDDGNCVCPEPGDPCMVPCGICPDGVSLFCPTCDPDLCQSVACPIEQQYRACVESCEDYLGICILQAEFGLLLAEFACLTMFNLPSFLLCIAGLGFSLYLILDCFDNFVDCLNGCMRARNNAYDIAFNSFCAGN